VATGGQWWAVWAEFAGTSPPQLDLFQAYTIGGTAHGRQRITTHPLWDSAPKLALTPGSTFPLTLVWVRGNTEGESTTQTDLRRALGNAGGSWSSSTLASLGHSNFWPDVAVVGTTTYLTWIRDGRAMFADNQSGRFVSRQFLTPVIPHGPSHVAVAGGVAGDDLGGQFRSSGRRRRFLTWPPEAIWRVVVMRWRRSAWWQDGVRYVDDGDVVTTGVLSGVDGALRVVERMVDRDAAERAARSVAWPAYSPGGAAPIRPSRPAPADVVGLLSAGYRWDRPRPGVLLSDGALRDIARTRDVATARWVAKTLQYPTDPRLSGPSWPWALTLRPILIAAAAIAAVLGIHYLRRRGGDDARAH
jgi:hypothetical protein